MYSLTNISKKYGNKPLFSNLNFSTGKSNFIGIFGPSGSGKTTLISILGLLDNKYTGNYIFNNEIINTDQDKYNSRFRKNNIGFVFQESCLINDICVYDNLLYSLVDKNNQVINEKINRLLEEFKLTDVLYQNAGTLSGGEKQRISLIRALIFDPNLIIADEPTGNLDTINSKIILDYLKKMSLNGKTIIIVSHDNRIKEYCDKTYFLSGGELKCL